MLLKIIYQNLINFYVTWKGKIIDPENYFEIHICQMRICHYTKNLMLERKKKEQTFLS